MPYNSIVSRANVDALIPEEISADIIDGVIGESAALSLFPRVTMSKKLRRLPVLSALPTAYWVSGDTGLKQTTQMAWNKKYLEAEEIACIVPVSEAVLEDADFDIWAEARPRLVESIGRVLDAAIFFGTNRPTTFARDLASTAVTVGNTRTRGTATQAQGGVAEDINQLMATVEADGYDVNGFVAPRTYRAVLRSGRDTTGQKLLDVSTSSIEGAPVRFALAGMWPDTSQAGQQVEMIAGDFSQGIVGIRRDITYKVLTEAVIQDNLGAIVYNLAQQDMVALRVTFRAAFQLANPINYQNATDLAEPPVAGNRYPFGVMTF